MVVWPSAVSRDQQADQALGQPAGDEADEDEVGVLGLGAGDGAAHRRLGLFAQELGADQRTLRVGGSVVTPMLWSTGEVRFEMPDFPNTQKVTVVRETADGGKTNAAELLGGP